jgi:hypothetical protein
MAGAEFAPDPFFNTVSGFTLFPPIALPKSGKIKFFKHEVSDKHA